MAIQGLTVRKSDLPSPVIDRFELGALPIIGKLRKGDEALRDNNGRITRPGKDLEGFRFTSDDPSVEAAFYKAYPGEIDPKTGKPDGEPKDINIVFMYASIEECFQDVREEYGAGGLIHRCDGNWKQVWRDPNSPRGFSVADELPAGQLPPACKGGCKQVGRMAVVIPELGRMATVTVETHSVNDIKTLTNNLRAVIGLPIIRGDLRGVPFILHRRPRVVGMPKGVPKGQSVNPADRTQGEKFLLSLEVEPSYVRHALEAMKAMALPRVPNIELLPPITEPESIKNVTPRALPAAPPEPGQKKETRSRATTVRQALAADDQRAAVEAKHIIAIGGVRYDAKLNAYFVKEDSGHEWKVSGQNGAVVCERLWDNDDKGSVAPTVCERLTKGRSDNPEFRCAHMLAAKDRDDSRKADLKAAAEA